MSRPPKSAELACERRDTGSYDALQWGQMNFLGPFEGLVSAAMDSVSFVSCRFCLLDGRLFVFPAYLVSLPHIFLFRRGILMPPKFPDGLALERHNYLLG